MVNPQNSADIGAKNREAVKAALLADPTLSTRAVARKVGIHHVSAGEHRRKLEAAGEIPKVDAVRTSNGAVRPERKASANGRTRSLATESVPSNGKAKYPVDAVSKSIEPSFKGTVTLSAAKLLHLAEKEGRVAELGLMFVKYGQKLLEDILSTSASRIDGKAVAQPCPVSGSPAGGPVVQVAADDEAGVRLVAEPVEPQSDDAADRADGIAEAPVETVTVSEALTAELKRRAEAAGEVSETITSTVADDVVEVESPADDGEQDASPPVEEDDTEKVVTPNRKPWQSPQPRRKSVAQVNGDIGATGPVREVWGDADYDDYSDGDDADDAALPREEQVAIRGEQQQAADIHGTVPVVGPRAVSELSRYPIERWVEGVLSWYSPVQRAGQVHIKGIGAEPVPVTERVFEAGFGERARGGDKVGVKIRHDGPYAVTLLRVGPYERLTA
jgi:hypothetical protein